MEIMPKELILSNGNSPLTTEEKELRITEASVHYGSFLTAMGFDWENDPNMQDTPNRVAKAYINELCSGCFSFPPKITTFDNGENYDGMVFQGQIDVISLCAHHNLPFVGKAHVAYIPGSKIIGLSKLNRTVEWFSHRPQSQEHLTMQIHNYLNRVCSGNSGIAIMIEANHTCASCRGVRHNSTMKTSKLSGAFKENPESRQEFYEFVRTLK